MILSFVGNMKYMSNKELKELLDIPYLNGINKNEIIAVLNKRVKWNTEAKDKLQKELGINHD